jgi:hypothetical protein
MGYGDRLRYATEASSLLQLDLKLPLYKLNRHPSASLQPPERAPATRAARSDESTPTPNGGSGRLQERERRKCGSIQFGASITLLHLG